MNLAYPSSVLFPARVVRQQLRGSHERSKTVRTPRFLGVRSLVPDHQTWERRIDLIVSKNFHGYPSTVESPACVKQDFNCNDVIQEALFGAGNA